MVERVNIDDFDWSGFGDTTLPPDRPEASGTPVHPAPEAAPPPPEPSRRRGNLLAGIADPERLPPAYREYAAKNVYKRKPQPPAGARVNIDDFDWGEAPGISGGYSPDEDWAPLQGFKTGWNTGRDAITAVGDMAQIMALPADQQAAAMIERGKKGRDKNQAHMTFEGIEDVDWLSTEPITFLLENATQMVGSWASAAVYGGGSGAATGAAIGGVGGAALGGVGAIPGAIAGGVAGLGYGTMAGFGAMGIGGMYDDLLQDKGVQEALANGTLSPGQVHALAATAGLAIGALDVLPASKIAKQVLGKAGGKKIYRDTIRKAALGGLLSGAKNEGVTEAAQGAISELGQALSGGNMDLAERALSVLNQGIAGAIGGAGLGAAGGVGENARLLQPPSPQGAPVPGQIGPQRGPAPLPPGQPGTAGPGAQPGGIAPGAGPAPHHPVGGVTAGTPPPPAGSQTYKVNYGRGYAKPTATPVTPGGIPPARPTGPSVVGDGEVADDVGSALEADEIGTSKVPEGIDLGGAAAGAKAPPQSPAAAASGTVDIDVQGALGAGQGPGTYEPPPIPPAPNVNPLEGLPDYNQPGTSTPIRPGRAPAPTPAPLAPGPKQSTYPAGVPSGIPPAPAMVPGMAEGLPDYGTAPPLQPAVTGGTSTATAPAAAPQVAPQAPAARPQMGPPRPALGPREAIYPPGQRPEGVEPAPTMVQGMAEGLPDYRDEEVPSRLPPIDVDEGAAPPEAEAAGGVPATAKELWDIANHVNDVFERLGQNAAAFDDWMLETEGGGRKAEIPAGLTSAQPKGTPGAIKAAERRTKKRHAWLVQRRIYETIRKGYLDARVDAETALKELLDEFRTLNDADSRTLFNGLNDDVRRAIDRGLPPSRLGIRGPSEGRRGPKAPPLTPKQPPGKRPPRGTPVALKPKPKAKQTTAKPERQTIRQRVTALTSTAEKLVKGKAEVLHPETGEKLGTVAKAVTHAPAKKYKFKTHTATVAGEEYEQPRVKLSFQKEPITLDDLFKNYAVQMPRKIGTLAEGYVPDSVRQRAVAAMTEHFATADAVPVKLKSLLFSSKEIASLEARGLAVDGTMDAAEFGRWQASEKGLAVTPVETPRTKEEVEKRKRTRRLARYKSIAGEAPPPPKQPRTKHGRIEQGTKVPLPMIGRQPEGKTKTATTVFEESWQRLRGLPRREAVEAALPEVIRSEDLREGEFGAETNLEAIRAAAARAVKANTTGAAAEGRRAQFEKDVLNALEHFKNSKGGLVEREAKRAKIVKAADEKHAAEVAARAAVKKATKRAELTGRVKGLALDRMRKQTIPQLRRQAMELNDKRPEAQRDPFFTRMKEHFQEKSKYRNTKDPVERAYIALADEQIRIIQRERIADAEAKEAARIKVEEDFEEEINEQHRRTAEFIRQQIAKGEIDHELGAALLERGELGTRYGKMADRARTTDPLLGRNILHTILPFETDQNALRNIATIGDEIKAAVRQEKNEALREARERGERVPETPAIKAFRKRLKASDKRRKKSNAPEPTPAFYRKMFDWAAKFVEDMKTDLAVAGVKLPAEPHSFFNTPLENGAVFISNALGRILKAKNIGVGKSTSGRAAPARVTGKAARLLTTAEGQELLAEADRRLEKGFRKGTVTKRERESISDVAAAVSYLKAMVQARQVGDEQRFEDFKDALYGIIFDASKTMWAKDDKAVFSKDVVNDQMQRMLHDMAEESGSEAFERQTVAEKQARGVEAGAELSDKLRASVEETEERARDALEAKLRTKWNVIREKVAKSRVLESPVNLPVVPDAQKTPHLVMTAREATAKFAGNRMVKGWKRWIQSHIMTSLVGLIGDVPVLFVDGSWTNNKAGVYKPGLNPKIYLNVQLLNRPELLARTLLHEMVHAGTAYALQTNRNGTRNIIEAMMRELKEQLGDLSTFAPTVRHAFKNADEFIAAAMEDGEFQELMAAHSPSIQTRARIRALGKGRVMPNWWDTFVATVYTAVGFANLGRIGPTYIDQILRVYPSAALSANEEYLLRLEAKDYAGGEKLEAPFSIDTIRSTVDAIARRTTHNPVLMSTAALDSWIANRFFDGSFDNPATKTIKWLLNHTRLVSDRMAKVDEISSRVRDWWMADPTGQRKTLVATGHALGAESSGYHVDLRHDLAGNPHVWDDANHPLKSGLPRAQPTLKHLQHSGMREAIPRLHAEWMALPQDLRDLLSELFDATTDNMRTYEVGLFENHLNLMTNKTNGPVVLPPGMDEAQAAQEIYDSNISPALAAALGPANLKTFDDFTRFAQRGGLYVPAYRTGSHFISGRYKVPTPAGSVREAMDRLSFLFADRDRAGDYVADMGRTNEQAAQGPVEVWADPATRDISNRKTATHTKPLYRVYVQDRFMAMSDSKSKLRKQAAALNASGEFDGVISEPILLKEHRQVTSGMPLQLTRMLNNVDQMSGVSTAEKEIIKQGMAHVFIQSQMGNRITKRLQHRKGVFGADVGADDMIASFRTTNEMMARHIVALKRIPALREAEGELNTFIDAQRNAGNPRNASLAKLTPAQRAQVQRNYAKDPDYADQLAQMQAVLTSRLEATMTAQGRSAATETAINTLMAAMTQIFLAGPSYIALQLTSVPMFTLPRMAAVFAEQYGYFRGWSMAVKYLHRNAQYAGSWGNLGTGIMESVAEGRHFAKGFKPRARFFGEGRSLRQTHDSVADVKANFVSNGSPYAAEIGEMLDEARLANFIGQAGMDQANIRDIMTEAETTMGKGALKVARGVEQSARVFRALTDGVEVNNRAIPMAAYYEFFRDGGMSHEQAKAKAKNLMITEQVGYSKENWSPWMSKHPLISAALLFKKFPLQIVQTYYDALVRSGVADTPEGRREARYQVANMTLVLGVIGGMTGNPLWEPLKYLYALIAQLLGWESYDELKSEGEKLMADWITGKATAEMVMYGAPRALGIDLSGRVALDTLAAMSLPKDDSKEGLYGFIGQILAGAPGSAAIQTWDFATGTTGDESYPKWLAKAPIPKFAKDIFKAYDLYTHGPTTATGVSAGEPINVAEGIAQSLGFRPSSQSRPFEVGSALQHKAEQRIDEAKRAMIRRMLNQGMTSSNMRRLQEWNRTHPDRKQRITTRDFIHARRGRRETERDIKLANMAGAQ